MSLQVQNMTSLISREFFFNLNFVSSRSEGFERLSVSEIKMQYVLDLIIILILL